MSIDVREVLDQQIVDGERNLRRDQPPVDALYVAARLDGGDDRRVGARPADAVLFQRADQRRLGVAGRRLGEVLLGQELQQVQRIALFQRRQRAWSPLRRARRPRPASPRRRPGNP